MIGKRYKFQSGKAAMPIVLGIAGAVIGFAIGGPMGAVQGAIIGYSIGSLIAGGGGMEANMSFNPTATTEVPHVSNYPIQQAQKGGAVPIVYGKRKVAGNIIWMGPITRYTEEI